MLNLLQKSKKTDFLLDSMQSAVPFVCVHDKNKFPEIKGYHEEGRLTFFAESFTENLVMLRKIFEFLDEAELSYSPRQVVLDFYWTLSLDKDRKMAQIELKEYEDPVFPEEVDQDIDLTDNILKLVEVKGENGEVLDMKAEGIDFSFSPTWSLRQLLKKVIPEVTYKESKEMFNTPAYTKLVEHSKKDPTMDPAFLSRMFPSDIVNMRESLRIVLLLLMLITTPGFYSDSSYDNAAVVFGIAQKALTIETIEQLCTGMLGNDRVVYMKIVCCVALLLCNPAGDYATIPMLLNVTLISLAFEDKYDEYTISSLFSQLRENCVLIRNLGNPITTFNLYTLNSQADGTAGVMMPNGDIVLMGPNVDVKDKKVEIDDKILSTFYSEQPKAVTIDHIKRQYFKLLKNTLKYAMYGFSEGVVVLLFDGFFFKIWVTSVPSQIVAILACILIGLVLCDDLGQRFLGFLMEKYFLFVVVSALAVLGDSAATSEGFVTDSSSIAAHQFNFTTSVFPLASIITVIGALYWQAKFLSDFNLEMFAIESNKTGITALTIRHLATNQPSKLSASECSVIINYFCGRAEGKKSVKLTHYAAKNWWMHHSLHAREITDEDVTEFLNKHVSKPDDEPGDDKA
ncbi:hypothetical protein GUITHDRAFT_148372 [Guillardia theta CCMP2712]|uniref:Uncharacterized protein n=1 Tax=Guillardia theta (strain CCMP2712) TaxID=905079 RepID=L1I9M5_GUITC|nr:hypothetical protein GUITHDRAFT_148372 [Guillardia theta CCMP2712]EKX32772.1 hypothetical protein GUITHDRAFT_148372 [Guillardia theta CCMP2712]|eukprot:XP_005819752.1 hypothetical protein GUITHDRAFT_148372 [Guillardia theta CCMP2712]